MSYHIYYILLLWQVLSFALHFISLSKVCKNAGPKLFYSAKPTGMFGLSFVPFSFTGSHTEHHWRCALYRSQKSEQLSFGPIYMPMIEPSASGPV